MLENQPHLRFSLGFLRRVLEQLSSTGLMCYFNLGTAAMGYLPENAPLYPDMTVYDYLHYIANVSGMGKSERIHAIENISTNVKSKTDGINPLGNYQKGIDNVWGLPEALIHNPPIVILDEPTTGLDPNQIVEMRRLIREIGKTKTVILSIHSL